MLGGVVLVMTLGYGAAAGASPGDRNASTPSSDNTHGAAPDNPYSENQPSASAEGASDGAEAAAPVTRARADEEDGATNAPESEPAEPTTSGSPPAAAERHGDVDMGTLAAEAAAEPPPPADDQAIAALDAVLFDDTADPISGVPDAPAGGRSEEPAGPSREDVQEAFASVAPQLRACVDGQQGRVVELRAVFRSSGRVAATRVDSRTAHFSPTERSCLARAARAARLPRFELERFEVTFPVRL